MATHDARVWDTTYSEVIYIESDDSEHGALRLILPSGESFVMNRANVVTLRKALQRHERNYPDAP